MERRKRVYEVEITVLVQVWAQSSRDAIRAAKKWPVQEWVEDGSQIVWTAKRVPKTKGGRDAKGKHHDAAS